MLATLRPPPLIYSSILVDDRGDAQVQLLPLGVLRLIYSWTLVDDRGVWSMPMWPLQSSDSWSPLGVRGGEPFLVFLLPLLILPKNNTTKNVTVSPGLVMSACCVYPATF
jgi:hypothetical protein